jgi:hypothetical protein
MLATAVVQHTLRVGECVPATEIWCCMLLLLPAGTISQYYCRTTRRGTAHPAHLSSMHAQGCDA